MLDRFDRVWLYDYDSLAARPVKGAWAFNADGMPMRFDEELADDEYVLPDDPADFPVCYSYTDADVPPKDYDPCKS